MLKVVQTVASCKACPHRMYGSANVYECTKAGQVPLPRDSACIPAWCPLPNDPAGVAAHALFALENAQQVLSAAMTEAPTASPERLRALLQLAADQLRAR